MQVEIALSGRIRTDDPGQRTRVVSLAGVALYVEVNGMQILEELYIGNVRPGERSFKRNSQYSRALSESADAADRLIAVLSEEQKKLFDEFTDAQREVSVLTDCETFVYGFQTGAKIMMDVLLGGEMKEI